MSTSLAEARKKLIVALDPPYSGSGSVSAKDFKELQAETRRIVEDLGDSVVFYKIGLRLFPVFESTIDLLRTHGKEIFLDLKSLDIPETVTQTARIAGLTDGIKFITVNHNINTVTHAKRGLAGLKNPPKILFVPFLTSLDETNIKDLFALDRDGTRDDVQRLVLHHAQMAKQLGCDGIVCSGHEVEKLRAELGPDMLLVVPGIRPAYLHVDKDDQKRTSTPAMAISGGADYLVVGRPIITAKDRHDAAEQIVKEIASAL